MTTSDDRLVEDYLRRLDAAAATLPPGRRGELVAEIREHISAGLSEGDLGDGEAAVRTVLDQLGSPDEIVDAARDGSPPPRRSGTGLELAAVLLLTVGSVIVVVGWLAGVMCLWLSRRWLWWEKVLGTLVVPLGPLGLPLIVGTFATSTSGTFCTSTGVPGGSGQAPAPSCTTVSSGPPAWLGVLVLVVVVTSGIAMAVWLWRRASARAAEAPSWGLT